MLKLLQLPAITEKQTYTVTYEEAFNRTKSHDKATFIIMSQLVDVLKLMVDDFISRRHWEEAR